MLSSIPALPLANPLSAASNTLPFMPSRISSLNTAIAFNLAAFFFNARRLSGKVDAPAVQPSPYNKIPGFILCNAAEMMFIVSISCTPIKSKRKPSTWYSFTQYKTDSSINLRIIAFSLAVSLPQAVALLNLPSLVWR